MAAFNKFSSFVEQLAEKNFNLGSDTLKIVLTLTAPTSANTVLSDLTQIANGNGYTTGGTAVTISSSAQTAGVYKLACADVTFTAAGGAIAPFRYVVLYDDTAASPADGLIGWWDYGSSLTLASGETFTVDFSAATGVLTIT